MGVYFFFFKPTIPIKKVKEDKFARAKAQWKCMVGWSVVWLFWGYIFIFILRPTIPIKKVKEHEFAGVKAQWKCAA